MDACLKNLGELTQRIVSRKYRTWHGYLSQEFRGINTEDYLKKIQDLTWMLVSRMQRNEEKVLSQECREINSEAYLKNTGDWETREIFLYVTVFGLLVSEDEAFKFCLNVCNYHSSNSITFRISESSATSLRKKQTLQ